MPKVEWRRIQKTGLTPVKYQTQLHFTGQARFTRPPEAGKPLAVHRMRGNRAQNYAGGISRKIKPIRFTPFDHAQGLRQGLRFRLLPPNAPCLRTQPALQVVLSGNRILPDRPVVRKCLLWTQALPEIPSSIMIYIRTAPLNLFLHGKRDLLGRAQNPRYRGLSMPTH
jgi:hypothetical protein